MKVTFVFGAYENLGIEYLSSYLKLKGHETALVFSPMLFNDAYLCNPFLGKIFSHIKFLAKKVVKSEPDLVAFSALFDNYHWATLVAKEIKKISDVPIVFGGIHPTSLPETVIKNSFIDYVCIGEGELAFENLCIKIGEKNENIPLKNIWSKIDGEVIENDGLYPLIDKLDNLPFPDKDIYYSKSPYFKSAYSIITSRGCPYNCYFCCNNVLRSLYSGEKKYLRFRSRENVLEELKIGKERYNYRSVLFHDDNLITKKKSFFEFMESYKEEISVPYMAIVHPKNIDRDVAITLKKTDCAYVSMGIQTFNADCRKNILNRFETNDEIINALKILKEEKIHVVVDHIFNLPNETDDDLVDAGNLYNKYRPDRIVSYNLTYYPSTEIVEIAKRENVISQRLKMMEDDVSLTYFDSKGDSKENSVRFNSFRNLFSIMPFVPKGIIRFILTKKRYRFLSKIPFFVTGILPNIVRALRGKEIKANQMIGIFLYNLLKLGY